MGLSFQSLGRSSLPLMVLLGATAFAACGTGTKAGLGPPDSGPGGQLDSSVAVGPDVGGMFGNDGGMFGAQDASVDQNVGPPPCDPSCAVAGGTCTAGVCTITENPGMVPSSTQTQLQAGGAAGGSFAWTYPYDQTVFPRGLTPPLLQFAGGSYDALYLHVTASALDYEGYFAPLTMAGAAWSAPVWTAITQAVGATDPVTVQATAIVGGQVTAPITETWTIAQGSLRGTIYYETYNSMLAGAVGIMKIQPGSAQPTVVKSGCGNVCHTASADGSTLVANVQLGSSSASYDLHSDAAVIDTQPNQSFTYGGLYPDGSFVLSATNYRTWNGSASALYDTHTGAKIAAPGWDGVLQHGGTTAFSPDGKHVAFVHEDKDNGHTLAVMDFDVTTHSFSNLVDIATHPTGYVAWPAFTPDAKWILYHVGSNPAFETDNGATGDVYMVDLATQTVHRADALDGYTGSGTPTYLPAMDPGLSFAPTILPEAVGGYFWVVFTSHRSYGNTLTSKMNADEDGKLWVAALNLSPTAGQDATYPAFFLDGQELGADNLRGFWVLSPCQANGASCQSGDECCNGFCRSAGGDDAGSLECVSPPTGCSNEYEKCQVSSDCCAAGSQCINGFCAQPAPQ